MKDTEPKKEGVEKALPELTEGQTLSVSAAIIKEGKSSPPQHFTEDTLLSTVIALLGVAVLITYSPQNGVILLVMAFLISPMGLPLAAIWLLGKVQSLKFAIQDWVYG